MAEEYLGYQNTLFYYFFLFLAAIWFPWMHVIQSLKNIYYRVQQ